jgi:signal transduction histidine kinase
MVAFAVPFGVVLSQSYRDRELLRLQRDTVAATRIVDIGVGANDPIELPRTGDAYGVYDRSGRLIAGRGPSNADAVVRFVLRTGKPTDQRGPGVLVAAAPVFAAERVTGVLRAVRPDEAAADTAQRAWLLLALLATGLIGLAILAALLLGRRLAQPLERLAAAARRLGDGEFGVRSPRSSIPEADAIAAALDATADRLHELVARERAFSADASHQLRTPLAALRLELEAMELRGDDSPELLAALGEIDRLQGTVDLLLAVSRDAPRREGRTDLVALLEDVASSHRTPLARSARPLRIVAPAGVPEVQAQPTVVHEILDVLLSNATLHGAGAVTVALRDAGPWVQLTVADEGAGIPEPAGDVFARRSGSGSGIGLTLARSLAHAEGGLLALTHRGPGPVFTLTLRAFPEPDAHPSGPDARPTSDKHGSDSP